MRPWTLFLPLIAWLASTSCTARERSVHRDVVREARGHIVGENARVDRAHDAVVAVRTAGAALCSGTIVRRNVTGDGVFVLTAAHCCRTSSPPQKVLVGTDFTDPVLSLPVASFHRHPCYNPLSSDYDFCVLDVRDGAALDIPPIPLASAPDELAAGSPVTVVGYGSTPASNTLRHVAEGQILEAAPLTIALDQTEGRGGICFGDSGGPVLVAQGGREVVAGVVSFGAPTSLCNVVGAAERVTFTAVRDEFLDRILAGEEPVLESILVLRNRAAPGVVRDTYLASDAPDQNFGDSVELLVGTPPGTGATRNALLRFDLSSLPAGAELFTARFGMHIESRSGPGRIAVHTVTRDWDEHRETWSSFGPEGYARRPLAVVGNASAVVDSTGQIWFDLTGLVERWASGEVPNYGILLRAPDGEETQLMSSEIGRITERPWMSVCYLPASRR